MRVVARIRLSYLIAALSLALPLQAGTLQFTDVTVASELFLTITDELRCFAPRLIDMDGDRYPELPIAAYFGTSRYFKNDGERATGSSPCLEQVTGACS